MGLQVRRRVGGGAQRGSLRVHLGLEGLVLQDGDDIGPERGVARVETEPLWVDMLADELQPLPTRRSRACRSASVLASRSRPHDFQQLDVFRLGPIAEARLGLALTSSTKLVCVQTMTDLRSPHNAENVSRSPTSGMRKASEAGAAGLVVPTPQWPWPAARCRRHHAPLARRKAPNRTGIPARAASARLAPRRAPEVGRRRFAARAGR